MRVAYLDTTANPYDPGPTGLRDVAWEMAAAAAALGVRAALVVSSAVALDPPPGVAVVRFPPPPLCRVNVLGHLLTSLRAGRELRRRGLPFDILHTPEYATAGVLAPRLRAPVVATVSGHIGDRVRNGNPFGPVTTLAFRRYTRATARHAAAVIAVSRAMERWWLASGVPSQRLRLIPSGVDLALFRPQPADPARFGFDPTRFNVIFVGRLSREKGPLDLLAAMRLLDGRAIALHVFGAGPLQSELERAIAAHHPAGAARLCGVVPRAALPALYSAADLIVLPSHTEALPRVMAEAMACGCPFLGARVSGIEDHIVDGDTGFLVPPHAPQQLAQRLAEAAGDRGALAQIAQRGRAYVADALAWPAVMRRVIAEVYERGPRPEAVP